jgi:hypothetical protein
VLKKRVSPFGKGEIYSFPLSQRGIEGDYVIPLTLPFLKGEVFINTFSALSIEGRS